MSELTGARAPSIVPLLRSDLDRVRSLLTAAGLEPAGLYDDNVRVFGIRESSDIAGCVAYEIGEGTVLLRSLAVRHDRRGLGWGKALAEFAIATARREGAREVLLLTESATEFFTRAGWKPVGREYVDARFPRSKQIQVVCPRSAASLCKPL